MTEPIYPGLTGFGKTLTSESALDSEKAVPWNRNHSL